MPAVPLITLRALAAVPLVLSTQISGNTWIQVSVTGPARNIATVSILDSGLSLFSHTLTQFLPNFKTTGDIVASDVTYAAPTGFALTVPTAEQDGSVWVQSTLTVPGQDPQPLSFPAVSWPLNSSLGGISQEDRSFT